MIRRTVLVFVGFVLLALAATVGYAVLGLSGPQSTFAEAEAAAASGHHAEAVRLLDLAERTLAPGDRSLRPRILELRFRSHRRLGNTVMALRDVRDLTDMLGAEAPLGLRTALAEMLLLDGQAEQALALVSELRAAPELAGDGRLLELSGEARQAIYQRDLQDLVLRLRDRLAGEVQDRAIELLRGSLYRHPADPAAERGIAELVRLVREHAPTTTRLDGIGSEVAVLRSGVRAALDDFQAALAADGDQPRRSAFRAVVFALDQAGADDDRVLQAEIYSRRFGGEAALRAGIVLAEHHYAAERDEAAIAAAERALPIGRLAQVAEGGGLPPLAKRLLVTLTLACFRAGDRDRLSGLAREIDDLNKVESFPMQPEFHLLRPYYFHLIGNQGAALRNLQAFRRRREVLTSGPPGPGDGPDLLELGCRLELQCLEAVGAGQQAQIDEVLAQWAEQRPRATEPLRRHVEHLLSLDLEERALPLVDRLRKLQPQDEDTLHLWVRVLDRALRASKRDAASLLERALRSRRLLPPEPHDPVLYLAVGELALPRQGMARIAQACAVEAERSYRWARWPHSLHVRAALAAGDAEEAHRAARRMRELYPDDPEAVALLQRAAAAVGSPDPKLAFDAALLADEPGLEVARQLLRSAVDRDRRGLLSALAPRIAELRPTDARLQLLAASGLQLAGDVARARNILQYLPAVFPDDDAACIEALARYVTLESPEHPQLVDLAARQLASRARDDVELLTHVAEQLEAAGQPRTAQLVLAPVMDAEGSAAGRRTGRHFALAGRLALAAGDEVAAQADFTAAISFDDGREANRPLALLWLLQGRRTDAASTVWSDEAGDEASAALMLALSREAPALRWARRELLSNRLHVPAQVVLALSSDPGAAASVAPEYRALAAPAVRSLALETLLLVTNRGFHRAARERAAELVQALPDNPVALFLAARARAQSGDLDGAIQDLLALSTAQPRFLATFDEMLRLTDGGTRGDVARLSAIGQRVILAARAVPNMVSPRMATLVAQNLATHLHTLAQNRVAALNVLIGIWTRFPQESRANLLNVAELAAKDRPSEARLLLDTLEPQFDQSRDRQQFLHFYFDIGRRLAAKEADPQQRARVLAELALKARKVIEQEGAWGSATDFLTEHLLATAPAGDEREQKVLGLLRDHFRWFAAHPKDSDLVNLQRCLDRFAALAGDAALLAQIDDLLRTDLALVDLWLRRAHLLADLGRRDDAVRSLRWLLAFVPDRRVMRAMAVIGGSGRGLTGRDRKLLAAHLPVAAGAVAPDDALATGLLALRSSAPARAVELLAAPAAAGDRTARYFLAAAHVLLGTEADLALARELFAALAADTSPAMLRLSTQVASFAAQLAQPSASR